MQKQFNLSLFHRFMIFGSALMFVFHSVYSQARQHATLQGRATDLQTGALLLGAHVLLSDDVIEEETFTDERGFFRFSGVLTGHYTLTIKHLGFDEYRSDFLLDSDTAFFEVELREIDFILKEAIVRGDALSQEETSDRLTLKRQDIELTHGGLEDPVQAVTALPGVTRFGGRFSSSPPSFRGGDPIENRYLLDNGRFIAPFQFGRSVFNSDVLQQVEVFTGAYPASYGQALSGILNFSVREGNFREWSNDYFSFDIGMIKSLFNGPIVKNKLSMITSVRSTYLNHLLDLFEVDSLDFPLPNTKDALTKLTWKVNRSNKISITNYFSWGKLKFFNTDADLANALRNQIRSTQNIQWQSNISKNLYNKMVVANSQIDYDGERKAGSISLREEVNWFLSPDNLLKAGFGLNIDRIKMLDTLDAAISLLPPDRIEDRFLYRAHDFSNSVSNGFLFVQYDGILLPKVTSNVGVRIESDWNNALASPRLNLAWQVKPGTNLKWGSGIYYRFANALQQNYSHNLSPEKAIHYVTGVEQTLTDQCKLAVTGYIKRYSNLILEVSPNEYANVGAGNVKGIEVSVQKMAGRFQGSAYYALMDSERTLGHDLGSYPSSFDHRHSINVIPRWILAKSPSREVILQLNYRYLSGRPYTEVLSAELTSGNRFDTIIGGINSKRYPGRHLMGLRIQWSQPLKKGTYYGYFEFMDIFFKRAIVSRSLDFGTSFAGNVQQNFIKTSPLDFIPAGGFKIIFD